MEPELKYKVAIIGGGPAGCTCAYFLQHNYDVTLFDKKVLLSTLIPTGGGRCNLAHAEYDFKELAKNYPRGEKFLYSIFSQFSTSNTLEFFKKIKIQTYTQEDMRIFPISNSSKDVREKFLKSLKKINYVNENVTKITPDLTITTDKNTYSFNYIVISIGGHSSFEFIKNLGHKIIEPKPSLTGLKTKEDFSPISGVSFKNILFTHQGVSGPLIYTISSIRAREDFPYKLNFDLIGDIDIQEKLNSNPQKSIKNLIGEHIPKSIAEFILENINIQPNTKCHLINGKTRDKIMDKLRNFEITVTGTFLDGEIVTSGGVDLNEINPKTLESKLIPNIYFCGEVIDIDGFCGGFNLQNCWSTGYVASQGIMHHI